MTVQWWSGMSHDTVLQRSAVVIVCIACLSASVVPSSTSSLGPSMVCNDSLNVSATTNASAMNTSFGINCRGWETISWCPLGPSFQSSESNNTEAALTFECMEDAQSDITLASLASLCENGTLDVLAVLQEISISLENCEWNETAVSHEQLDAGMIVVDVTLTPSGNKNNNDSQYRSVAVICNFTERSSEGNPTQVSTTTKRVIKFGLYTSLVCLTLCLAVIIALPELRKNTDDVIFLHYCLSLWSLTLFNTVRLEVALTTVSCTVLGAALHYLLLVVFGWSVVLAVHMDRYFVTVAKPEIPRFVRKSAMLCYGIPGMVLFISRASTSFRLGSPLVCMRVLTLSTIISPIAPLCLGVLVNMIVYIRIMRVALRQSAAGMPQSRRLRDRLRFVRVASTIFLLLGITWAVGLTALFIEVSVADMAFAGLMAFTGIFIFFSKVVLAKSVHRIVKNRYRSYSSSNAKTTRASAVREGEKRRSSSAVSSTSTCTTFTNA